MAEESKPQVPPSPEGEAKPAETKLTTEKPIPPAPATSASPEKPATPPSAEKPTAEKPATPPAAAAAKPPAPPAAAGAPAAAKPAAPAKPAGPVPMPWTSPLVEKYKAQYGSGLDAQSYLGQNYFTVDRSLIPDLLRRLRDDEHFDYCVDVTAAHYPQREKQFDIFWILYSFERNERIRVKTQIGEGDSIPSAVPIWVTANWLEREVYDMFGIKFDGHPDMRRILLPEDWKGFPLRKDYGILQQDKEWVQINLGIESGQ
jgi:NADH-quinone oxidoreductase subunit C